jgi:TetR/AcrR family transcriptional regulator, regulator of cefoperazone and chloramphenicol sensitivity
LYRDGRHHADEIRREIFSAWSPGVLRVDVPTAVDVCAALCNIGMYTTLTVEREWLSHRVETSWGEVLRRELLA